VAGLTLFVGVIVNSLAGDLALVQIVYQSQNHASNSILIHGESFGHSSSCFWLRLTVRSPFAEFAPECDRHMTRDEIQFSLRGDRSNILIGSLFLDTNRRYRCTGRRWASRTKWLRWFLGQFFLAFLVPW